MFGLTDPESGKFYRKRTRLDSNHKAFKEALELGGQCCHAPADHEPIIGTCKLPDGRSVPRSTWASRFTPKLARHILTAARKALDAGCTRDALAVTKATAHQPREQGLEADPSVNEELAFQQKIHDLLNKMQREEDERQGDTHELGARYEYISFEGAAKMLPRPLRNMVAKLHSVLCHPSKERLCRMLSMSGFPKEAITAAKSLRCEVCVRVCAPRATPKVVPRRAEKFNE